LLLHRGTLTMGYICPYQESAQNNCSTVIASPVVLSSPKHAQKRIKLILDTRSFQLSLSEPVTEFLVGTR